MANPELTPDLIQKALANNPERHYEHLSNLIPENEIRVLNKAAVILPMLQKRNAWHLLMTVRSEKLSEHRGQVAFPGGVQEYQDQNLRDTALREMAEEIGVVPYEVDVFGHLGDMPVITGYCVRPFVGQIPWPYPIRISGEEVEDVFTVPLGWLSNPENRYIEYRSIAGREFPVTFFKHYEGHQLWGASAEMTLALLRALGLTD